MFRTTYSTAHSYNQEDSKPHMPLCFGCWIYCIITHKISVVGGSGGGGGSNSTTREYSDSVTSIMSNLSCLMGFFLSNIPHIWRHSLGFVFPQSDVMWCNAAVSTYDL